MTTFLLTQAAKALRLDALGGNGWQPFGEPLDESDVARRYEDTPWFRRGVDVRCEALAALPYAFYDVSTGEALEPGVLPPLPFDLELEALLNIIEGWLTLYGAAYLYKGYNAAGVLRELRPIHPLTVTPRYSAARGVDHFERRAGETMLILSPVELAYIWLPSRRSEVGPGVAPARAALAAANLLNSADEFGQMYFQNGVIAPALVTLPPGLSETETRRLETWAQRTMSGLKKAFHVLGVSAEVKVNSLGQQVPLGDLALPALTDKKREDIATVFGVPHSILFSNAATYATARQDDLHFYDKTIIPEARRIERALNRQVFIPLGWRLSFRPELLEVYQALEAEKADKLALLYDRGIYSREEVRAELGVR
ncbi:MAG: phage portal protein [Chloroflexota bacterium]